MRKTLLALASTAALAAAGAVVPTTADAHCHGCGVAAGLVGGLAAGALIGSAMANSPPPPPPPPTYEPYPAYVGPVPVACPGGYWARRPYYDRWGRVVGWSRPRFFCP